MLKALFAATLALALFPPPAQAEDTCYKSWIFRDKSGQKIFRLSACKRGAPSKSGYYEIENLSRYTRKACWTIVLGNGKKSEGCRTLKPGEVGGGSCYSCNPMHQGGGINGFLRKWYDPNSKDKNQKREFEGTVTGPDGRTGNIGLNPVGKPPPKYTPRPPRRDNGPNIVEVPEHPGRKYGGPVRKIGLPKRPGGPNLTRSPRTATPRSSGSPADCGMGPAAMAEFSAFSSDPKVMKGRLKKLTGILECLDKQPGSAEIQGLKGTLGMLKQTMQMMAR